MKSGLVYMYRNIYNGKCYIGQTTTTVKRRARSGYQNSAFGKAIKKYGLSSFDLRILGVYPIDTLNSAEKCWIAIYLTNINGYNLTHGGTGYFERNKSFVEKMQHNKKCKKIFMFDKSGILLREFESISEAVRQIKGNQGSVSRCLMKRTYTADGFCWSDTNKLWFEASQLNYLQHNSRNVHVNMYSLDGQKINSFLSIKSAHVETGISYSSIKKNLRGIRKHAGGFIWKYCE